ncbi:Seed maturation protein [Parasponia andersonii]|uniref:Seed maturation protein n=1 Tax=Parasponia andersonii TaxID=3476 RepID=A0A2P5DKU4_PARAD|nr:Seed maturation protein [Parasponia andersonii]
MRRRAAKGDLAGKPITPGDAAIMQSAEYAMLGKIEMGCAATTMQSAASQNERAGLVGYDVTDEVLGEDQGISMTEKDIPDRRIVTEAVGWLVVFLSERWLEWSDAAAIQAAEVRATGRINILSGGVAAAAQSAASRDEGKTKLGDVLADTTSKLPADRAATRRDSEGVTSAE